MQSKCYIHVMVCSPSSDLPVLTSTSCKMNVEDPSPAQLQIILSTGQRSTNRLSLAVALVFDSTRTLRTSGDELHQDGHFVFALVTFAHP